MNVFRFLAANWDSVLVVASTVVALAALAVKKQWGILEKVLFALVTWSEREYGNGTGALKFAAVVEKLSPHIPAIIRAFVSTAKLEGMINNALDEAKERWEKNPKLLDTVVIPPK